MLQTQLAFITQSPNSSSGPFLLCADTVAAVAKACLQRTEQGLKRYNLGEQLRLFGIDRTWGCDPSKHSPGPSNHRQRLITSFKLLATTSVRSASQSIHPPLLSDVVAPATEMLPRAGKKSSTAGVRSRESIGRSATGDSIIGALLRERPPVQNIQSVRSIPVFSYFFVISTQITRGSAFIPQDAAPLAGLHGPGSGGPSTG
ncbi:hypothetical protein GGX14DRAFT_577272 [Mycena pura]|uniref:Uncharacterized protein n=1 Tax=Mycena pura TaxID=153505 RepID=A0AAD6UTT5_9AGAR|nr:hypothetical protein GGX14DRAFT_577272 [Mycena pura]